MSNHPLSVQLFSVRHDAQKDLEGTLKAIRAIGYEGVDFFGYHGPAERIQAALNEAGLFCAGWHVGYEQIATDEALEESIAFHRKIGNRYLVLPGLPHDMTTTREGWLQAAARLQEVSNILAPLGMYTGYHNHTVEFAPLDGEMPWDTLFSNTDRFVIAQLDIGNAMAGGADAVELLKKYPGRSVTIHLKPYSARDGYDTMIGEDDADWATIKALCEQGGTQQYIVEYESEKLYSPMEGVRLCYEALRKLGY